MVMCPARCVALLLLLTPFAAAQKVPDVRVNTGSPAGLAEAGAPVLAAVGSTLFVTWCDSQSGQGLVRLNRSDDGGATWLASGVEVNADAETRASEIALAAGDASSVFVAWTDWRDGLQDVYFNRSLDGGATWLPSDTRLDVGADAGHFASERLRIVAQGSSVYVVWWERTGSSFSNTGDIYFNRSLDGGQTWLSPARRLNDPGLRAAVEPRIVANGASVYAAWIDNTYSTVAFNRSLDGGTTWLPQAMVIGMPHSVADIYELDLALAGTSLHVAWMEEDVVFFGNTTYTNHSDDGGVSWLASDVVVPGADLFPSLAIADGAVALVSRRTSDILVNRSTDGGDTWGSALPLDSTPYLFPASEPQIEADGSTLYAAWIDDRGGSPAVYYNRSIDAGATWLATSAPLDLDGSETRQATVALSEGSVHAAWREGGSFKADVWYTLASGHQTYGTGKPGSAGAVPILAGTGHAAIGGTVTMEIANGLGGTTGLLLVSTTGPTSIPIAGGLLLVLPPFDGIPVSLDGMPGAAAAGSASVPVPVPLDPALFGQRVNWQAIFFDAGASGGFSLTAGVETWVL